MRSLPFKNPPIKSPPFKGTLIYEWGHKFMNLIQGRMMQRGCANAAALLNSRQTIETAKFLIERGEDSISLTCCALDPEQITSALKDAAARDVDVIVVAGRPRTFKGATQKQLEHSSCLNEAGVHVALTHGTFGGIRRSKTMVADRVAVIGSTSRTDNSLTNTECSV